MPVNIKCINKESEEFPPNLLKLKDCPKQIFVTGNDKILTEFSLAMVGARRCSILGERIAKEIASNLSSKHIHIVSGLAYGIDTFSHMACLSDTVPGKAIGVLGCGIQYFYKNEKRELFDKILKMGRGDCF